MTERPPLHERLRGLHARRRAEGKEEDTIRHEMNAVARHHTVGYLHGEIARLRDNPDAELDTVRHAIFDVIEERRELTQEILR